MGFWAGKGGAFTCPNAFSQWKKQLHLQAESLIPQLGESRLYKKGPKFTHREVYNNVIQFWEACGDKAPQAIVRNYQNLLKHGRYLSRSLSDGHSGFPITDMEYVTRVLTLNSAFITLPDQFFVEGFLPNDWEEQIKVCRLSPQERLQPCRLGEDWKVIDFQSTLEDGSGHHRRLIFQIPRGDWTQFLLFFPENTKPRHKKLIDIIAVQTHHFKTHQRLDKGKVRPYFLERHGENIAIDGGRCYTCHPNGLREIRPMTGTVLSKMDQATLEAINQNIRQWSQPDWQGVVDPTALGPPMGKGCVKCHDNREGARAPLTIFTLPSLIESKIFELEMPPTGSFHQHFQSMHKMVHLDTATQDQVYQAATQFSALPDGDYRNWEEVKKTREQIWKVLYGRDPEKGGLGLFDYTYLRALAWFFEPNLEKAVDAFFEDYKGELFSWLKGD